MIRLMLFILGTLMLLLGGMLTVIRQNDKPYYLEFNRSNPTGQVEDCRLFHVGQGTDCFPVLFRQNSMLSPDGRWRVFTVPGVPEIHGISRFPVGGGAPEYLTEPGEFLSIQQPVWSPDGRWLAFPAQAESQNLHIYRMNVESREIEQLTSLPGEEYSPAWSSDGERIAFSMDRATLYTMRADGSDLQAHLEDLPSADAPVWSPDGEWLAFHSTCPGEAIQSGDYTTCGLEEQWFIHLMRLADGHIESLTPLTSSIHNPAWSPDGEWIAFSSRDGMIAPAALFRMCPDGSDAQPLTFDPTLEHFYPRWVNVPDMDWRPIFLLIPALIFVAVGWRRDS